MGTQKRRTSMPITDAVYPRRKREDSVPPEQRLAEHRVSVRPIPRTFRISGAAKGQLSRVEGTERKPKRRRGGRGRKPVAA